MKWPLFLELFSFVNLIFSHKGFHFDFNFLHARKLYIDVNRKPYSIQL